MWMTSIHSSDIGSATGPVAVRERVRDVGDPVAAVDEVTAGTAIDLIEVDYEPLPAVANVAEALAQDAPLVQEGPLRPGLFAPDAQIVVEGNVCYRFEAESGEWETLFSQAEHVVGGDCKFPVVYQYALETHTVTAEVRHGGITVWSSCQHSFVVRAELALVFGRPLHKVRVLIPYVGGGFGSKSYTTMEPITVALARKAGHPVRIRNRVGDATATTRRHGMTCRMRRATSGEGRLLARELDFRFDTGAYADNGPRVTGVGGEVRLGPYPWAGERVNASGVYTNSAPVGSCRAFGALHVQWVGESQIDELARRAGPDPLRVRLQNLCRQGDQVRPDGGKPSDADLVGDLETLAGKLRAKPLSSGRGRGLSVGLIPADAQPASEALVRLDSDGHATVSVGTTKIGQGTRTVFAQTFAEVLSLRLDRVTVHATDAYFTPCERSTGASRSTTVGGLAVQQATEDVRRQLKGIAGRSEVAPDSYAGVIARRFGLTGGGIVGHGETGPYGVCGPEPLFWQVCMAGAEVEVDWENRAVRVARLVGIADVGKAINPQLVERQDEGAALQGIGNAFFEEIVHEDGYPLTETLLDYPVPSCEDVPESMGCIIAENRDGPGQFGAKAFGEGGFAAVTSAIVIALAGLGIRGLNELALTPERIWRQIRTLQGKAMLSAATSVHEGL